MLDFVEQTMNCPRCGQLLSTNDPNFGSWRVRDGVALGPLLVTFVPRTAGIHEVVVHECKPRVAIEPTEVLDIGWPVFRTLLKSDHPERN